jgi:hypothetical protein
MLSLPFAFTGESAAPSGGLRSAARSSVRRGGATPHTQVSQAEDWTGALQARPITREPPTGHIRDTFRLDASAEGSEVLICSEIEIREEDSNARHADCDDGEEGSSEAE